MTVLPFSRSDIPEALELEKLCFSMPWSEASLALLTAEPYFGLVCRENDLLVAYGGLLCVAGEAQILNVATSPNFRRRGYARLLLEKLCLEAKRRCAESISLEVRESNLSAISLYTSSGFIVIGTRKDYYSKPRESAIIMEKKL